jgi:hypothetical protein
VHSFNTRSTHREVFVRATSVRDKHLLAGEEDGVRALQPVGHVVRVEDRDLSRGDDDVFSTTIQPPYSLLKIHRFALKGDGVSWGVGTRHYRPIRHLALQTFEC